MRIIAGKRKRAGSSPRRRKPRRGFLSFALLLLLLAAAAVLFYHVYGNTFLRAAYPQKYADLVERYSAQAGLDPNLVYAVIRNESNFNPKAQSGKGARGLMQLTPDTFEWAMGRAAEQRAYTSDDLYRPEVNIQYGTRVLAIFLHDFGDEEAALAAYNAGPANVRKWLADKRYSQDGKTLAAIPFSETRRYVVKVEESKKMYLSLYAAVGSGVSGTAGAAGSVSAAG